MPSATASYFYPRPPWGGRQGIPISPNARCSISIHALRGEGDRLGAFLRPLRSGFLSTPSVGRATTLRGTIRLEIDISIHALRGEGDCRCACRAAVCLYFYPRPPWGGRPRTVKPGFAAGRFLSTPSVGRATTGAALEVYKGWNFYPRPPWGGRRGCTMTARIIPLFLSTPSVGRATAPAFLF